MEKPFFKNNELQNFNFKFYEGSLNPETVREIPQEIKDQTTVISVFTDSDVTAGVIKEFKNLRIISTRSTAFDHICIDSARERNIAVLNVSNYGETAVAQFTFGLIIALTRKLIPSLKKRKNSQSDNTLTGRDIANFSIGIIGTGAIGASVCRIARNGGMKVYGYDINEKHELVDKYGIEYLPFEEIIKVADIITLHLPFTGDNFHMFSNAEFENMKQGAYFINTSSRKLVDIEALYNGLKSGKLQGIALDTVYGKKLMSECFMPDEEVEHCKKEAKYLNSLFELDNVIITPHIAYNTVEAVEHILQESIDKIRGTFKCGNIYGVY